jgi:hypothetical protein
MKTILRVCGGKKEDLIEAVARLSPSAETRLEIFDLAGPEPDYGALLEAIFRADVAQVWRRDS